MRTPLDCRLTERSLRVLNVHLNQSLMDALPDDFLDQSPVPLKNVCAKVSQQLSDDIDEIVGLLDIRKRRFLEAAFIEAVQRGRAIMEAEGVWDAIEAPASEQVGAV